MMLELDDEVQDEFHLFGVQTAITDETKFIFLLNNAFHWKLQRIPDLDVTFKDETFCYSTYLYEDPHNLEDYVYVIKNQSHDKRMDKVENSLFQDVALNKSRPLLNKYKTFRYLIKLPIETDSLPIKHLTLPSVDFIYNIQPIEITSNKEKKYFLI
ncbi:IPExxxVDY family protein [Flavobacteriaceae bacterium Ap0902]|nr:IPExxxVDY family protein [Flavobacteriaceae bacterium Ap0902]